MSRKVNLNYLFNKEFYSCLADNSIDVSGYYQKKTEELCAAVFDKAMYDTAIRSRIDGCYCFTMKTLYPGLLVGIGNPHGSGIDSDNKTNNEEEKKSNNDIKLGFSFDYTTGIPYIPGSTIKGVLKSAFRQKDLIRSLSHSNNLSHEDIDILTDEIFNSGYDVISERSGLKTNQRDIFYDAVIVGGDETGHFIGTEYITPHSSQLRNPNPIKLIKIIPDVKFEFRFRLSNSQKTEMAAKDKLYLFAEIISLLGIGAKTNTGFGIMRRINEFEYTAPQSLTPIQQLRYGSYNTEQKHRAGYNAYPNREKTYSASGAPQTTTSAFVRCPDCGVKNYRINLKSGEINYNWKNRFCYKCKKTINTKGV